MYSYSLCSLNHLRDLLLPGDRGHGTLPLCTFAFLHNLEIPLPSISESGFGHGRCQKPQVPCLWRFCRFVTKTSPSFVVFLLLYLYCYKSSETAPCCVVSLRLCLGWQFFLHTKAFYQRCEVKWCLFLMRRTQCGGDSDRYFEMYLYVHNSMSFIVIIIGVPVCAHVSYALSSIICIVLVVYACRQDYVE